MNPTNSFFKIKTKLMEKKQINDQVLSELSSTINTQPEVGNIYSVKRLDGEYIPAELLEIRCNELKGGSLEYFVHFENTDKRLDEWVDLDRLDLIKGPLPKHSKNELETTNDLGERKMTRNQKRKNDITSNNVI